MYHTLLEKKQPSCFSNDLKPDNVRWIMCYSHVYALQTQHTVWGPDGSTQWKDRSDWWHGEGTGFDCWTQALLWFFVQLNSC